MDTWREANSEILLVENGVIVRQKVDAQNVLVQVVHRLNSEHALLPKPVAGYHRLNREMVGLRPDGKCEVWDAVVLRFGAGANRHDLSEITGHACVSLDLMNHLGQKY